MLSFEKISLPIAVSSAAIAYLAYRFWARRARRDTRKLHAEVCEERESLRSVVEALPEQLESERRSLIAAVRAAGQPRPAATQQWLSEMEVDLAEAKLLGSQLPTADDDAKDRSGMELDIKLAEILALSIRANRLADKYRRASPKRASSEETLDAESLFEQAASLPAQARAQHAAASFIAPS